MYKIYEKNITNGCVLSATMVSSSATRTDQALDRSGWIMLRVLVMKQTLYSVVIMDGEDTTVITPRTSQYRVLELQVEIEVSNVYFPKSCVFARDSIC